MKRLLTFLMLCLLTVCCCFTGCSVEKDDLNRSQEITLDEFKQILSSLNYDVDTYLTVECEENEKGCALWSYRDESNDIIIDYAYGPDAESAHEIYVYDYMACYSMEHPVVKGTQEDENESCKAENKKSNGLYIELYRIGRTVLFGCVPAADGGKEKLIHTMQCLRKID